MNLSEKSAQLTDRGSAWLAANGVDLLLAFIAAALIALVLLGLRSWGSRLVAGRDPERHWRTIAGRVLARTSTLFILLCAAKLVAENAATPPALLRAINILFVVGASIQGAVWARELVLGLIEYRVGESEPQGTFGSAVGLIRGLVTVALFAIAVILILSNLGVDVTGLVAGLGIGGIAIGLAAQGVFKDLFAALAIIFDKPFRRGDTIRFDQVNGTVEQIGLKTTRIRSVDGEQVVVSNAILLDKLVHNMSSIERRRSLLKFGLASGTAADDAARVPMLARAAVERHPPARFVRCGLVGIGAATFDYELEFAVDAPGYDALFGVRDAILTDLIRALGEAGLQFAPPPAPPA